MKVYVVHPGAGFSTSDVYDGLVAGLRMCDGIDLYEGRIDTILTFYNTALQAGLERGVFTLDNLQDQAWNRQRLASAHITQHILTIWPDLVIVVSGHNYHLDDVRALRRIGFDVAIMLTETPYFGDLEVALAGIYSAAFTNERIGLEKFRLVQPRSWYLPHAYNPSVHTLSGEVAPPCDAFFVGSWFPERVKLLDALEASGINLVRKGHDTHEDASQVLPNARSAAHYRSAGVSLNIHRTSHGGGGYILAGDAESLNPRAYEIPACGGFQLMDDSRPEGKEIFRDSLATYKAGDAADLEKQVRWWLNHPDMREEWAGAQHDMVQPHTWDVRARQVLEALA